MRRDFLANYRYNDGNLNCITKVKCQSVILLFIKFCCSYLINHHPQLSHKVSDITPIIEERMLFLISAGALV